MDTVNDLYRRRQGQSPTACPPEACVCDTCGMLECLCRPRFFAGQILTADDLNRLDGYIRGKNRLHNRHLHGWGVVNGLEVTCNPCGDGVAVGCGYALSPCGEDIVVCEAVSVDVCDLIRRCKDAERKWQACAPLRHPTPRDCDAGEEEWILAIRYAEAPARGVQPLRPNPDCTGAAGCACGGSKGKCGCGGACGGIRCSCGTTSTSKPRGAPVQCEPTSVCEGFAFEVYRKPPDKLVVRPGNDKPQAPVFNPDSELRQRFECCVALLIKQVPALPGPLAVPATEAQSQAWYQWVNTMRAQLQRYLASHGSYNCKLLDQFNSIPYPSAGTLANAAAIFYAAVLLLIVWLDTLLACFCSALLPPCPAPSSDERVPLASIHISGKPCRVERICNWTVHRKFATTIPSLQYWLAILPFGGMLREMLERMCCFEIAGILPRRDVKVAGKSDAAGRAPLFAAMRMEVPADAGDTDLGQARAAYQQVNSLLNPTLEQPEQIGGTSELILAALARTGSTLEFSTLIESLMLPANKRSTDTQYLSATETANLPQFLLANQFMRPAAGEAFGPLLGMIEKFPGLAALGGSAGAPVDDEMAAIRAQLTDLQASVKAHSAEIDRLRSGHKPAPKRNQRKPG